MGIETREKRLWMSINTKEGKIYYKDSAGNKQTADRFSGYLRDIKIENKEYQGDPYRELQLFFEDGGEKYVITVNADTGSANSVLNTLLNIENPGRLTIGAILDEKDNKSNCHVWIRNNGQKTNGWKYKRDADGNRPEGFPEPKKTEWKEKEMWDFTPISNFLWDEIQRVFLPKIYNAPAKATEATTTGPAIEQRGSAAPPAGEKSFIDDDLPF